MKCLNCEQELDENVNYCVNCGSAVDNSINDVNKELGISDNVDNSNSEINNKIDINNKSVVDDGTIIVNKSNENNIKKKSKKGIILIIISILVVAIACLILFLFIFNRNKSAKKVFVDSFKNFTSEIFSKGNVKKKSLKQAIKYNISGNGLDEITSLFNSITINNNMSFDIEQKKLDDELTINYDKTDILGLSIYARDNNVYLGLNGLYDKYVKLPITEEQYKNIFKSGDNSIVIKEAFDEAFEKSLDEKYFTKGKKSVDINDKNKKLNAYTLTINNNNIKDIAKIFINNLVNNEKFISMITKANGVDISTIKNEVNNLDYSNLVLSSPVSITIYTEGIIEKYAGIEFSVTNEGSNIAIRIVKVDKNNIEIIFDMGVTSFKIKINKTGNDNKNTITASIDMMGLMKMNLLLDTTSSDKVDFKDINTNQVVDYDYFVENGLNDVMMNIGRNEKLLEFINKLSNLFNSSYSLDNNYNLDYSNLGSLY